jgi:gluconolactonase
MVTAGLGWPEGPTILPDGRLVFVESYRSHLTVVAADRAPRRFAYVSGAPNSCVLAADGWVYVCQNGGTVGPWRAAEMIAPSIQRVREGGKPEVLIAEVEGIALSGPNDLVFAADGPLIFTDPGAYNPSDPDPSYIHALAPDGKAQVVVAFPEPVLPNGLVVESDGSIVWGESYTGHVRRRRPDGAIEDLGRLPGHNPTPDGMKIGADGRLFVMDISACGIRVLDRVGAVESFIPVAKAPTNRCFDGETLWVTDAGVLADRTEPSSAGQLWRVRVPKGGPKLTSARLRFLNRPRLSDQNGRLSVYPAIIELSPIPLPPRLSFLLVFGWELDLWKFHAAPRAEGDFDNAASVIMNDDAKASADLRDRGIWAVEPVRVLAARSPQIESHSFAAKILTITPK